MSLTLVSIAGKFDPFTRDQAPVYNVMAKAVLGVGSLAERLTAQNMILRDDCSADFVVRALQAGSAATDAICDLVTLGVTFPTGTIRKITIEATCSGDAAATEKLHSIICTTFLGGATPLNLVETLVATGSTTPAERKSTLGASWTGSDPAIAFGTTGASSVPINVTNEGAAESNSWLLRIKVGKAYAINFGV